MAAVEDDWEGAVVVFSELLALFEATVDVGTVELMGVADVLALVALELLVLPAGVDVVDGVCTIAPEPELLGLLEATVDVGTVELMGVADVLAPVVLELLVLPAGVEGVDSVCTTVPGPELPGLLEATVDVGTAELMGIVDVLAPVVFELLVLPAGVEVVNGVLTTAPDAVPLATPELAGTTALAVLCMLAEPVDCGEP